MKVAKLIAIALMVTASVVIAQQDPAVAPATVDLTGKVQVTLDDQGAVKAVALVDADATYEVTLDDQGKQLAAVEKGKTVKAACVVAPKADDASKMCATVKSFTVVEEAVAPAEEAPATK